MAHRVNRATKTRTATQYKKAKQQAFDHGKMICTPLEWPKYPVLPLKRWVKGKLETAVIFANTRCMTPTGVGRETADPEKPFMIYEGITVFNTNELHENQEHMYANLADLLDSGWKVD